MMKWAGSIPSNVAFSWVKRARRFLIYTWYVPGTFLYLVLQSSSGILRDEGRAPEINAISQVPVYGDRDMKNLRSILGSAAPRGV